MPDFDGSAQRDSRVTLEILTASARELGLAAIGVAGVRRYLNVEVILCDRKAAGLSDTMEFTYRNPLRSSDPRLILAGARSVITTALAYGNDEQPDLDHSSLFAKYAKKDFYAELSAKLQALADVICDAGYKCRVILDSNAMVDKEAASRAGIGTYLKNSLISVKGVGTQIVLGSIVTDAWIARTKRRERLAGCGRCVKCIEACPTGAIAEFGVIDARRCLAWILQKPGVIDPSFLAVIGLKIYGCDICQDVCPYNASQPYDDCQSPDRIFEDILYFLSAGEKELLDKFSHLYIRDRDPSILRRNALIALGNFPFMSSSKVDIALKVLRQFATSSNDVLSTHANWSISAIESRV